MLVAVICLQDGRDLGDDDDLVRERVLVLAVIDARARSWQLCRSLSPSASRTIFSAASAAAWDARAASCASEVARASRSRLSRSAATRLRTVASANLLALAAARTSMSDRSSDSGTASISASSALTAASSPFLRSCARARREVKGSVLASIGVTRKAAGPSRP